MKPIAIILIWVFILAISAYSMFGCKSQDTVTITKDGCRLHSAVPVDTNGLKN